MMISMPIETEDHFQKLNRTSIVPTSCLVPTYGWHVARRALRFCSVRQDKFESILGLLYSGRVQVRAALNSKHFIPAN